MDAHLQLDPEGHQVMEVLLSHNSVHDVLTQYDIEHEEDNVLLLSPAPRAPPQQTYETLSSYHYNANADKTCVKQIGLTSSCTPRRHVQHQQQQLSQSRQNNNHDHMPLSFGILLDVLDSTSNSVALRWMSYVLIPTVFDRLSSSSQKRADSNAVSTTEEANTKKVVCSDPLAFYKKNESWLKHKHTRLEKKTVELQKIKDEKVQEALEKHLDMLKLSKSSKQQQQHTPRGGLKKQQQQTSTWTFSPTLSKGTQQMKVQREPLYSPPTPQPPVTVEEPVIHCPIKFYGVLGPNPYSKRGVTERQIREANAELTFAPKISKRSKELAANATTPRQPSSNEKKFVDDTQMTRTAISKDKIASLTTRFQSYEQKRIGDVHRQKEEQLFLQMVPCTFTPKTNSNSSSTPKQPRQPSSDPREDNGLAIDLHDWFYDLCSPRRGDRITEKQLYESCQRLESYLGLEHDETLEVVVEGERRVPYSEFEQIMCNIIFRKDEYDDEGYVSGLTVKR